MSMAYMSEGAQVVEGRSVGDKWSWRSRADRPELCLEMLLCNVVWMAAQASWMAVGGWFASS